MGYVKITVLKTDFDSKLAEEYGVVNLSFCPLHTVGQEIICERHYQPREICGEAWKAMQHYVYALYHGTIEPFGKGWMRNVGVAIVACNDGLRPVTFKLEKVDE